MWVGDGVVVVVGLGREGRERVRQKEAFLRGAAIGGCG